MTKTERALQHLLALEINQGAEHVEAFRQTIAKFGFYGANAQRLADAHAKWKSATGARAKELESNPFHPVRA